MFTELIERTKTHTNNFIPIGELVIRQERNFEAYCSLFPYSDGIIDHINLTKSETNPRGTVSGYEGDVYCRTVWFDIDCEGSPASAYKSTCELVNRLLNKYNLRREHLTIFFSGSKGFHIGFSSKHVGGFNPCNELPYQIKRFVERITEGIEYIDLSIYNLNRFFRLPFSKHETTGLFKIPLSVEELEAMNILEIRELAKESRIDFKFDNPRQIVKNEALVKDWLLSVAKPEVAKVERDLLEELPTDQEALFQKAVELTERKHQYAKGERNNYLFQLASWCNDLGYGEQADAQLTIERIGLFLHEVHQEAYLDLKHSEVEATISSAYKRSAPNFATKTLYLKSETEFFINEKTKLLLMDKAARLSKASTLTKREIAEILLAINANKQFPISEDEVYKIVTTYTIDQNERAEDDFGATMAELAAEYYVQIVNQRNEFALDLEPIDRIEQNDYSAKVIGIIGKAGTKKSLLLKHIMKALTEQGGRGIYSTMEDGKIGQFKRFLASSFQPVLVDEGEFTERRISAAEHFKNMIKSDPSKSKEAVKMNAEILQQMYGDRLIIDEKTAMSYEDYEHFIEKVVSKYGAINLLGIDGLSMMYSTGDELSAAIENSKRAKELANKYKICVPLLIHVPSAVSRYERHLFDKTRGGAKVADNCDMFISLSQVIVLEDGQEKVSDDLVYVAYWGKRTSGRKTEFILRLDPLTLNFELTDLDPNQFNLD